MYKYIYINYIFVLIYVNGCVYASYKKIYRDEGSAVLGFIQKPLKYPGLAVIS